MEPLLACSGLRRTFGDRVAVEGITIHIDPGETYGLLGPNGSGKTTTISMIAGILRPDAGEVRVAGRPLTTSSTDTKAAIGLVPQEIALYEDLSAVENLKFFGRLQGLGAFEPQFHDAVDPQIVVAARPALDPFTRHHDVLPVSAYTGHFPDKIAMHDPLVTKIAFADIGTPLQGRDTL